MSNSLSSEDTNTPLALAALMFFAPFVQYLLRHRNPPLAEEDQKFITGYISLGYLTLILLIVSACLGIGNYFAPYVLLGVGYAVCMGILLLLLLIGTVCVLAGVTLHLHQEITPTFFTIQQKRSVLIYFLPLYNIYLRYHLHSFDQPNRWVKESLLRWTFFLLLCVTYHPVLLSVLLIVIVLRVATLMIGIDVLPIHIKQNINALFIKNPEELWGYVSGTCLYCRESVVHVFHKASESPSLQLCVDQEKEVFSRLYPLVQYPSLWGEYLVGLAILGGFLYRIRPDQTLLTYYIPLVLLGGRYLIMLIVWQHLPRLPLAREIWSIIRAPFVVLFFRHQHV